MPEKFDEMADGMFMAYGITGIKRESLAAALRSTDAKAREEERERCAGIAVDSAKAWSEGANDDPVDKERALRYRARAGACAWIANRIRSPEPEAGGEACATRCDNCAEAGETNPCPDCPEPACQGGDDAE